MALSRFAGMQTYANATPIVDVPEADETAHKVTWQRSNGKGIDADHLTGNFTIVMPGIYIAYAMLSFIGTTGITYFFELRGAGGAGGFFRATADGVTGAAVNVALMGGTDFNEGDTVSLHVWCDEDGENIIIVDGQFGVISL